MKKFNSCNGWQGFAEMIGVLRRALSTCGLWAIWTLEAVNFLVHVSMRPQPWNRTSTAIGYALWAFQLTSLFVFQYVDPGSASADWELGAREGEYNATVCKRTGKLLPPRAMYVRRAGAVVLGIDHYCGWLGTPVGLRNRKLFVLFVCYSAAFCVMGSAHSIYALVCALPDALIDAPAAAAATTGATAAAADPAAAAAAASQCRHVSMPAALSEAISQLRLGGILWEGIAFGHAAFAGLLHLLGRAQTAGHLPYALLLVGTVPANLLAAGLLGGLAWDQIQLVSRNRTTLDPKDTTYDIGIRGNWRQWFGPHPLLWPLPLPPRLQADGYEWPLNPSRKVAGGVSARRGGEPDRRQLRRLVREALSSGQAPVSG